MLRSYLGVVTKPCEGLLFLCDRHLQLSSGQKLEGRVKGCVKGRNMPPKKRTSSESDVPILLLGRFGTSLKCGIVGLPNVG